MDCLIAMLASDLQQARINPTYRAELLRPDYLHAWLRGTCTRLATNAAPMERSFIICAIAKLLHAEDSLADVPEDVYCRMLNDLVSVYVIKEELRRERAC